MLTRIEISRRGSFGDCCRSTISVPCHIYICGQSIFRFECPIGYMFLNEIVFMLVIVPHSLSPLCAVLDGIGKGLDPRFDITEIAKP